MRLLALTAGQQTMWSWLLVVGVVVLLVVVALLHVLLREVAKLDGRVARVWQAATHVARNTATTWQLGQTAEALRAVRIEATRHARLLEDQQ